jgi:hypothetical protein
MKTLHSLIAGFRPAFSIVRQRIAFPLLLLGAGLVLVHPCAGAPFEFEETGSLANARSGHTATLLPNGKVLAAGGFGLASAELYDPASGTWTVTGKLINRRFSHTATLLPNGKVLVAFGYSEPSAELYDVRLGFSSDWQPEIDTATLRRASGNRLFLTGSLFQGISQASGGNTQDSSTNYPIVQLRSLDSSQVVFLPVDPVGSWSDTSFVSIPVRHFPFGPALVTVFTNGIPSTAKSLLVAKHHH